MRDMKSRILISAALFAVLFTGSAAVTRNLINSRPDTGVRCALPIQVDTVPSEALLFINGIYSGTTPRTVYLEHEKTALRVTKKGFYDATKQIKAGDSEQVRVRLTPIPKGSLSVFSVPSGASVFAGETFIGKTPITEHILYAGTYRIQFIRANYLPQVEQVTVPENGKARVDAPLESKIEVFYKTALAAEPDNIHYHAELAHYYLITDRKEDCVAQYKRGLHAAGSITKDISGLSRLLNEIRKLQHKHRDIVTEVMPAIEEMVRVLEKNTKIGEKNLRSVARRLKMLHRPDLAERLVRKRKEREFGFFELREMEKNAHVAAEQGNNEKAYRIYMELADVYEKMAGNAVKLRAVSHLKKAANMQKDLRIRVGLGMRIASLYRKLDMEKERIEILEKILAIIPKDMAGGKIFWDVCSQLSRLYAQSDNPVKARYMYESIIKKYEKKAIQDRARKELKRL